jgi:DNA end-binding protein Ku
MRAVAKAPAHFSRAIKSDRAQPEIGMAARSIWKGSISFGLVNIPIKLYSAVEDRAFSFNQLCPNGHRIQYRRWCPVEEKEVPYAEIKKGYEIAKDNYVLLEKSDFEKIKIKSTKTIDIKEFVDLEELDPIFVEKSYYVGPEGKAADKAYNLMVGVLKDTKKVAIGKVTLREREQLVALRAYQRGIVMHMLHYLDEIKPMDEIKEISETAASKAKLDEQELALGRTLVEQLTSKELDVSEYSDSYSKQLEELISARAQGRVHVVQEEAAEATTKDLLEALKASVRKAPGKKRRAVD